MDNERDDFTVKLLLIEKQALLCLHDLPPGLFRERIEEIATTAKLLRLRLGVASAAIVPPNGADAAPDRGFATRKL
jgi:hypothetical protein